MNLLAFTLILLHVGMSQAFQPSLTKTVALRTTLHSNIPHSAFYDFDPVSKLDLDHAHDCAENFGKCPIKELEEMKLALKTERLQHEALGLTLDPEEELDHRLLEEDLALQLSLLKEEMSTTPLYNNVKKSDTTPSKSNAVAAIANPDYYHHDHTLRDYVEQGEELFLMPNGLSDAFSFGMALLIIALSSLLLQQS